MEVRKFLEFYLRHPSICTDSRSIREGEIFFALKGENFDGNLYVADALEKGASYAVSQDQRWNQHPKVIVVDDTLKYLQSLAHVYRDTLDCTVIGLTGSNGKTTTKELCHVVLSSQFRTHSTKGNFNNHIGVPLTILKAPRDVEYMIVEMGANHIGEIFELCQISNPDIGIITNIGKAHLEGFGSIEGVEHAKTELYRYVISKNGTLIYDHHDDKLKRNIPTDYPHQIKYRNANILQTHPEILIEVDNLLFESNLFGNYNIQNVICAITLGFFLKVPANKIQEAIKGYIAKNNRSELQKYKGADIILDAYNANPTSMEQSIRSFAQGGVSNKMLILGDMLELGEFTTNEHQAIVNLIQELGFQNYILIGEEFQKLKAHGKMFRDVEEAKTYFDTLNVIGSKILIKGSRGLKLEKLLSNT